VNEGVIVAVGLATAEDISSLGPEVTTQEATPEAGKDFEMTTLNIESQREHEEVDVTVPSEAVDTLSPDIHSNLRGAPTPVSLPVEPEISLTETELVDETQVETTSAATTNCVSIDVEVQPDPNINQTAPNGQEYIEAQIQVDDVTSNIKDEPIPESDSDSDTVAQRIEASADTEGFPLEDVPASSTEQSQNIVQLVPEVDFVAPAEEDPLAITQAAAAEILLAPKFESKDAIPQTPGETIPIPEDATASVANVEDQIIAPVDVGSEHAAETETCTEEVIPPPNVEESPETLTPLVEPSYKSSDDKLMGVSVLIISMHLISLN
jgi:hypothetical protein